MIVRYGVRSASGSSYGRGQIRNTVSIRERPVEADAREVAGHRERLTRASTRRCGGLARSELGKVAQVHSPVIDQWLALTHMVGMANPPVTAVVIAIIETLAALALIFGVLSNAAFVGSAILSFGIWSGAEAFHLPFHSGITDLGPSVGYIFASLALFFAAAGSSWSVDGWLRPRLGAFAWLAAPAVGPRRLICVHSCATGKQLDAIPNDHVGVCGP